jgi:hypothetical protein
MRGVAEDRRDMRGAAEERRERRERRGDASPATSTLAAYFFASKIVDVSISH